MRRKGPVKTTYGARRRRSQWEGSSIVTVLAAASLLLGLWTASERGGRAANVTIVLYGSTFGGWGFSPGEETNPGPTLIVSLGNHVTMQLASTDGTFHRFWIDYNGNGSEDAGEPLSPSFSSTPLTYEFDAAVEGTFSYYCSLHCGSPCNPITSAMRGTWTTTASPTVTITSPTVATSWTGGLGHSVVFNLASPEPLTNLTVWVNYTHSGGVTGSIAGPIAGTSNPNIVSWTPTGFSATDVVIGIEALDAMGRRGSRTSPTFEVDSSEPSVSSTVPVAGAMGVPPNAQVRITWSEGMNRTATGSPAAFGLLDVSGSVWVSGSIAWSPDSREMTFTPGAPLNPLSSYRAHANTTARDDSDPGNPSMAPVVWAFTTGSAADQTPPTVSSVVATPAAQSEGGAVNLTATVMDDVGVGGVAAHVVGPSLDVNLTMTGAGGNRWYLNRTYAALGTYGATVWATDAAGNAASATTSFEIIDRTAPEPPPRVLISLSSSGSPRITWDPSPTPDVVGYHVHRGISSGGPYSPLTLNPLSTATLEFVDEAADPGRTHYYVVTAVDEVGNESPFSMEVAIATPRVAIDPLPFVVTAAVGATLGIGGYLVWRRRRRANRPPPPSG